MLFLLALLTLFLPGIVKFLCSHISVLGLFSPRVTDGKVPSLTDRIEVGSCNGLPGNYVREINTLVFAQKGNYEIHFEHELIDSFKLSCEKKVFLV